MCRAEEPIESMVLSIAKPRSSGGWLVPASRLWDQERVMVWLPTVKYDSGAGGTKGRMLWTVDVPRMRLPLGWRAMCVLNAGYHFVYEDIWRGEGLALLA